MATLRTFIALETSPDVQARALDLIKRLQVAQADVRWVAAVHMHLSLRFLGDVHTKDLPDVCNAVTATVKDTEAFDITCQGAGAFPDVARPRTLWMGVGQGREQIIGLHEKLEAELAKVGFRPEGRAYHPHLTLGRIRRPGPELAQITELLERDAGFAGGQTDVSEVVVFSSEPGRNGPVHEPMYRAELKD
jgi:2'-5' RNA ligase